MGMAALNPLPLRRATTVASMLARLLTRRGDPEHVARELENLGPTFVKLGQALAARPDLLGDAHRSALRRLHDDVRPLSHGEVVQLLEEHWGRDASEILAQLDEAPLGAASLGQVHAGRLRDGTPVAVKVQRPGVAAQVETDLQLMARAAEAGRRLDARLEVDHVVAAFSETMRRELDYRLEAANLVWFGEHLEEHEHLAVPRPYLAHTTRHVLVMELMTGSPLAMADLPPDVGRVLAVDLCEAFVRLMLEHGRFHADPHLGNLLVRGKTLQLLDFGQVDLLDADTRRGVVEMLLGVVDLEATVAAGALAGMCAERPDANPEALRQEVAATITRVQMEMGTKLDLGRTVFELLSAATTHGYRPPAALAGPAKMLCMLDELALTLHPSLDPMAVVRRQASGLVLHQLEDEVTPRAVLRRALQARDLASRLPRKAAQLLDHLADGTLRVNVGGQVEQRVLTASEKIANRIAISVVIAAMVIASAQFASVGPALWLGLSPVSLALLAGAALLALAVAATSLFSDLWSTRR